MSAAVLIISPLGLFFIYMCVYVSVCVMALDMGLLNSLWCITPVKFIRSRNVFKS